MKTSSSSNRTEAFEFTEPGRLDKQLARESSYSRNRIQRWIQQGRVELGGSTPTKSTSVEPGQVARISVPDPSEDPLVPEPEDEPLEVLHEGEDWLAVNKPTGLLVHPAGPRRTGTLVGRLLHHYPDLREVGPPDRPGIVHRLDEPTSGVLLVARTGEALEELKEQFRERTVEKTYRALVTGDVGTDSIRVEVPLSRRTDNPTLRRADPGGKPSVTRVVPEASSRGISAVWCHPKTGRTHQIRVHCQYLGHPILGDEKYGSAAAERLMLHAEEVVFTPPGHRDPVRLRCSPPADFQSQWDQVVAVEDPAD